MLDIGADALESIIQDADEETTVKPSLHVSIAKSMVTIHIVVGKFLANPNRVAQFFLL